MSGVNHIHYVIVFLLCVAPLSLLIFLRILEFRVVRFVGWHSYFANTIVYFVYFGNAGLIKGEKIVYLICFWNRF